MHLDLKHTGIVQSALQNTQAMEEPLQMRGPVCCEEQRFVFF